LNVPIHDAGFPFDPQPGRQNNRIEHSRSSPSLRLGWQGIGVGGNYLIDGREQLRGPNGLRKIVATCAKSHYSEYNCTRTGAMTASRPKAMIAGLPHSAGDGAPHQPQPFALIAPIGGGPSSPATTVLLAFLRRVRLW
jgi:hypothetical protein